jgi:hypothetical protein
MRDFHSVMYELFAAFAWHSFDGKSIAFYGSTAFVEFGANFGVNFRSAFYDSNNQSFGSGNNPYGRFKGLNQACQLASSCQKFV